MIQKNGVTLDRDVTDAGNTEFVWNYDFSEKYQIDISLFAMVVIECRSIVGEFIEGEILVLIGTTLHKILNEEADGE